MSDITREDLERWKRELDEGEVWHIISMKRLINLIEELALSHCEAAGCTVDGKLIKYLHPEGKCENESCSWVRALLPKEKK